MRIIKGMHFQDKIRDLSIQLSANKTPLTIITEHISYVEDMLLMLQDTLFSIEVKTLHQFEKDLLLYNHKFNRIVLSKTELVLKIRHILSTGNFQFFKLSDNPYQLIDEIITTLHLIHNNQLDLKNIPDVSPLTRQKCQELAAIDAAIDGYMNLEEACADLFNTVDQPLIILGDDYPNVSQRELFKQLDQYTDLTMYLTCHEGDGLSSFYEGESIDESASSVLTDHLFDLDEVSPIGEAYVMEAGSPMQEVMKVTSDIKEKVTHGAHYSDFVIIVMAQDYRDYLRQIFDAWQYPHDLDEISPYYYNRNFKKILKYLNTHSRESISSLSAELLKLDLDEDYQKILLSLHSDDIVSADEYLLLLEDILPAQVKKTEIHDCIHITDYQHALWAQPKYVYMMNLNEGDVPAVMQEKGLLLDEDLISFKPRPLNMSEQLLLHYMHIIRAFTNSYYALTFSYAANAMDGKEKMPSTLMNRLHQIYHLIPKRPDLNVHLNHFYLHHGQIPDFVLNEDINHYDNKPAKITSELQPLLGRGMSVSRLETYDKCPYQYYLKYGLKIQPLYEDVLQPTELGSLCHYIMEKAIDDEEHLKDYAYDYVKENLQDKYQANALNTYFIDHLIDDMGINVKIVQQQLGDYTILDREEEVKGTLGPVHVQGFIDRIDAFADRIRIIDYKSGDKDLNLSFAMQGFNVQMLTYLDLYLKKHEDMKPGAVFYYSMKRRVLNKALSKKMSLYSAINENDYFKAFKMNGYFIDDDPYIAVNASVDGSTKQMLKKDNTPAKSAHLISTAQYREVMEEIVRTTNDLYSALSAGHIDITPALADNDDPSIYPCTFCPYKSICQFDVFVNETRPISATYGHDIYKKEAH